MTEQDEIDICIICQKPILPGKGRYRTEKGDVHTKCAEPRQKKADTVNPCEPKEK